MNIRRFSRELFYSVLRLFERDAGAAAGPVLQIDRDSSSPAVDDLMGYVSFTGRNSAAETIEYGRLQWRLRDPTDASEDAWGVIYTMSGGTFERCAFFGQGLFMLGATGSDLGAGTINATALYENNVRVATLGANSFDGTQTIKSTDPGASAGPDLQLFRDSASPAANDMLGRIIWYGKDTAANMQPMSSVECQMLDPTSASEDSRLLFYNYIAGASTLSAYMGAGVVVGSPNGGDPGVGKLNAGGLQVNSFPVYATRKAYATADQGPGFATDTYVTGSRVVTSYLNAGAKYRFLCRVSKTAAGAATPTVILRAGTAGSTADTAIATLTFPAQTAAVDDGWIEVEAYFTAVGASAVCRVTARLTHALSITGLSTSTTPSRVAVASAFNSDTASMGIGISLNGGASASWTVSNANAELGSIG